uniref:Apple domain-containing protein n=1 Tax=Romanomermis culicivorax TaxID=13658 RepID=A0A915KJW2_ROMCU
MWCKIRNLFFTNMVDRVDNEFNAGDLIGLVRCGVRAGHLDCLRACARDRRCMAVTYMPQAALCLMSSSEHRIRIMENPGRDFFKTILYTVPLD